MKLIHLFFLCLTLPLAAQHSSFLPIQEDDLLTRKWGFLKKVLKNKRIVGLGESLHGVKDYNLTKLELIQYLHEELGYNVLAIENDVARNFVGNLDRANIPDTLLLKELFSPIWHTPEYLTLINYLKAHPNLQLIGFDVEHKLPLTEIAQCLNTTIDNSDPHLVTFQQRYATWLEVNGSKKVFGRSRDSTMATIVQWIADKAYPGEKIILSAHNLHLSKVGDDNTCMGVLLKKRYKRKYYCIGLFHSLGNPKGVLRNLIYENDPKKLPENSLQAQFLACTHHNKVFVPIRQYSKKRYDWLFKPIDHVFATRGRYNTTTHLADGYDGLIWIRRVTHPEYLIPNAYLDQELGN